MRHLIYLFLLPVSVVALWAASSTGQATDPRVDAVVAELAPSTHQLTESMPNSTSTHGAAPVRRRVPQDHATIQAAIDACSDGDTVLVSEGTYYENIRYKGKGIVVGSLFVIDGDSAHISRTIIDGSAPANPDSGSVVYCIDGEDTTSVLCGLTITGGTGTRLFWSNAWYRFGGGILCHNSGARIIGNVITRNRIRSEGVYGGGIATYTELASLPFVIVEGNTISGNYAQENLSTSIGSGGAGAMISGADCRIVDNVFEKDTVIGYWVGGGGLSVAATPPATSHPLPSALVRGNVFRANVLSVTSTKGSVGAGMMVVWTKDVTIDDNIFEDNVATSTAGWAEGGALSIQDSVAGFGRKIVTRNRFLNNRCNAGSAQYPSGGAVLLYLTEATLDGNEFTGNSASGGWGGAIAAMRSAFLIQNNIIANNSSSVSSGGVGVSNRPLNSSEQVIVNNTFFQNQSVYGGGIAVGGTGVTVSILNNILWADTAPNGKEIYVNAGAAAEVHHCDIQGGWASGVGNIDSDPLFVPSDSEFNLTGGSPCIGGGLDSMLIGGTWYFAPATDYDGHARPRPSGEPPDIGAQEDQIIPLPDGLGEQESLPDAFRLCQNYPNPFNPSTTITFALPKSADVRLSVYDMLGREVSVLVHERRQAGVHEVTFDASGLPSGVYIYRLVSGEFSGSKKLLLVK